MCSPIPTMADHREVIPMATGSEVSMCLDACEQLKLEGVAARVVSMPSWELFELQDKSYRDAVFPPEIIARVAVEKASILGWTRYTGFAARLSACGLSASRRRSRNCSTVSDSCRRTSSESEGADWNGDVKTRLPACTGEVLKHLPAASSAKHRGGASAAGDGARSIGSDASSSSRCGCQRPR
jgi:hypothetical protein